MIGTPPSFAGTPESARGDHDVLAEMLRAVRLTGSVFLNARFSEPFGVVSPKRYDERTPMAHLRHVSIFHLIAAGAARSRSRPASAAPCRPATFCCCRSPTRTSSGTATSCEMAFGPDIMRPGPVKGMWTVDHGGGGEATRMVCGFIESSEFLFAPVFRSLPPLLVDRTGDDKVSAVITSTVREILALADAAAPGTELDARPVDGVAVRRGVAPLRGAASGQRQGLVRGAQRSDRRPRAAIRARDPARRWTVDDLAREAGSSRTVLAERFNAVMGQAPIEYVTSWRMQLAAERIRNSDDSLAAIAADVGYEFEAAFNRAFKRVTGVTPGRWREVPRPRISAAS